MKAIISSTYDNNYLFFIPICVWAWNKLGVDVICFMPVPKVSDMNKLFLISNTLAHNELNFQGYYFYCPEHKEATYAQVSRLYAACLDLPEDEVLISSDVDMCLFKVPPYEEGFTIFGGDLVPKEQIPMCYISAKVIDWRKAFKLDGKTYQECLDNLLGHIETEHFRGNYWGKDQETAYNNIATDQIVWHFNRAREGTQFASKRYDRDDAYILDRLSPSDTIDFHMNRPGYEDRNFEIILTILKYHYPLENFDWLISYTEQYKRLL